MSADGKKPRDEREVTLYPFHKVVPGLKVATPEGRMDVALRVRLAAIASRRETTDIIAPLVRKREAAKITLQGDMSRIMNHGLVGPGDAELMSLLNLDANGIGGPTFLADEAPHSAVALAIIEDPRRASLLRRIAELPTETLDILGDE